MSQMSTGHGKLVRRFFVLPWRGHTLLGTTDAAFSGSPDNVRVSDGEIDTFLAFVDAHLPHEALARKNVVTAYAGLRPLVDDGSKDTYGASRRAELIDHAKTDRVEGLLSAIGGKWTTSRDLAEKVVDAAAAKLGAKTCPPMTTTAVLPGGHIDSLGEFRLRYAPEHDHLARLYGSRLDDVLALAKDKPELFKPLSRTGDIGAQILFAMREEMALTLEDVVMRRTGIGQLGPPPPDVLDFAAAAMANELAWSEARKAAEIASLAPLFRTGGGT